MMASRVKRRVERPADIETPPERPSPRPGEALSWTQIGKHDWEADEGRARIRRLVDHEKKEKFYATRNGQYLGSDATLELSQRRAQNVDRAPRYGDRPLEERRALEQAEREKVGRGTTKDRRALTDEEKVENTAIRRVQAQADLARMARKGSVDLDPNKRIRLKDPSKNPRKAGTGKHTRYEVMRTHHGKSVETYVAAGGNAETLANAIKEGLAELE